MRLTRIKILAAMTLSMAVHMAAAAILIPPQATLEIAGGAETSQLVIGNAFEDSLMAGETGENLKPVETLPSETASVEPLDADQIEQATEAEVQPAAPETQPLSRDLPEEAPSVSPDRTLASRPEAVSSPVPSKPVQDQVPETLDSAPLVEAVPTRSEDLASIAPASEIGPAARPEPESALPENIPLPMPRPEPPDKVTAKSKPADSKRTTAAQTRPKKPRKDREQQRIAAKPSNTGDGGKQRETTSRAASGSVAAKRTSAAGNAAVSNYPGKIASKLRRSLRYPREAQRQRIRGDVVVSFVVTGNGGVSGIRVLRSSGSQILDGAATDAVRRAAPFPPIPARAGRSTWSFSVPLGFTR